jgi:hypothetical protein
MDLGVILGKQILFESLSGFFNNLFRVARRGRAHSRPPTSARSLGFTPFGASTQPTQLTDTNALTPDMHRESGFDELFEAIERKMAE